MIYLLSLSDRSGDTGLSAWPTEAERWDMLVGYAKQEYGDDEGFPSDADIAEDPGVVTDYLNEVSDNYKLDECDGTMTRG